jgi:hypothetical protein
MIAEYEKKAGEGMKKDQRSILRKGISFLVEKADGRFGSEERTLRYECIHTPKIPKSFDGYRILQLSDLHGQGIESAADSLFETVIETRPNLICLTGDYIRNE